jgi:hypothetical protein
MDVEHERVPGSATPDAGPGAGWQDRRGQAIDAHARALARRQEAESARAGEIIQDFVREALRRGLRQTRLIAHAYDGGGSYRTGLSGWYINVACTLAVDAAGAFYILSVPGSWRSRLTGAVVHPDPPRLIIGEGGRDGSSIPIGRLLEQRLAGGDEWPPR